MGEIWRDVPSVPDILASSEGRVMYGPHREPMPKGGTRCYGGQPTFGVWSKQDGRFILVKDGVTYKVHRLVAEARQPTSSARCAREVSGRSCISLRSNGRGCRTCWKQRESNA